MRKERTRWTDEELKLLKEYYLKDGLSLKKIAVILDRPYSSVKNKSNVLSLQELKKKKAAKNKSVNKPKQKHRPYTLTTDMLIAEFMDENNYNTRQIAYTLDRDYFELKNHIEEITKNGTLDRIRKLLKNAGGVYAYNMLVKEQNNIEEVSSL